MRLACPARWSLALPTLILGVAANYQDVVHGSIQGLEWHETTIELLREDVGGLAIVAGDDEGAAAFHHAVGQGSTGRVHPDEQDSSALQGFVACGRVNGEW